MADSEHPLLAHEAEDRLWDEVEEGGSSTDGSFRTMHDLLAENPNEVIKTLAKTGVRKLGEFCAPDYLVLDLLGDDSIATMGASSPDIDWEAAWREELRNKYDDKAVTSSAPSSSVRSERGWSTDIPVIAYVVTLKGAAYPDKDGLLQPLLRRWQSKGCSYSVFALPAVQSTIDWKWNRYCKRLLLAELAFFILWLTAFYTFTGYFQDEDATLSLRELLETPRGKLTVACDFLSLVGMTPFVLIEISTIYAYGITGWATAWNILDVLTYFLQISIVAMHIGRLNISSGWLSIAAATQCILLLFRLQYFSRVFTPTKFAFLDDLKEVVQDVRWYLLFILLIVLGYAAAFQILFRQDQKQHEEFNSLGHAFMQMVTWSAGNADLSPLYNHAQNPVAACVLGVSFVFILGMVLLNLLIGLMTNSLDRVTSNEGVRLLLSKAQAIDEIEAVLPPWIERKFPELFPPFLFVLRVDPQKLDSVQQDSIWAARGDDERAGTLLSGGDVGGADEQKEEGGGGSGGGEEKKQGQSDEISKLQQQISALSDDIRSLRDLVERQQHSRTRSKREEEGTSFDDGDGGRRSGALASGESGAGSASTESFASD
jgi:Ion transport protein